MCALGLLDFKSASIAIKTTDVVYCIHVHYYIYMVAPTPEQHCKRANSAYVQKEASSTRKCQNGGVLSNSPEACGESHPQPR